MTTENNENTFLIGGKYLMVDMNLKTAKGSFRKIPLCIPMVDLKEDDSFCGVNLHLVHKLMTDPDFNES